MFKFARSTEKIRKLSTSDDASRQTLLRFLVEGAASVLFSITLVLVFLQPSKGLDVTDEGLYFLAMAAPGSESWGFPWGWHLWPLSDLLNQDIATIRLVFSTIMLMLFYVLGRTSSNYVMSAMEFDRESVRRYWSISTAFVSTVGGLTFFGALLNRTPGYNWVNLAGIIIALTGLFALLKLLTDGESPILGLRELLATAVFSFGAFYSFLGKPTTTVIISVVFFIAIWVVAGFRSSFLRSLTAGTMMILMVLVSFLTGVWPRDFADVLVNRLDRRVSLSASQTISGAVESSLRFPLDFVSALYSGGAVVGGAVFLGLVASIWLASRSRYKWPLISSVLGFAVLGLILANFFPWPGSSSFRWVDSKVSAFGWGFLLISLAHLISKRKSLNIGYRDPIWVIASSIFIAALAFGFGSGHGVFRQSSLSIGLTLLAIVLIGIRLRRIGSHNLFAYSTILIVVVSGLSIAVDSGNRPYRFGPLQSQNVEVSLDRGGTIDVDQGRANLIFEYKSVLTETGWQKGDPLVGLTWRWNSALPHVVGAKTFPTLMPTLFGYGPELDVLEENLERASFLGEEWKNSVIVLSSMETLDEGQRERTLQAARIYAGKFDLVFERDYVLASKSQNFTVYQRVQTD